MGFPTSFIILGLQEVFRDDFNRSNSATVGNGWGDLGVDPLGPWEISSNQVMRNDASGAINDAIYRTPSAGDQYAECVPLALGIGPCVRISGAADGYHVYQTSTAPGLKLFLERRTAGGGLTIDSSTLMLDLSSDILRIEALGSAISAYKNGVQVLTASSTHYSSGNAGITARFATGDVRADNFAWGA